MRGTRGRRVRAGLLAAGLAPALLALGCRGPKPGHETASCTHVRTVRVVQGEEVCEDAFTCERPPGRRFDRAGLHRLAPCDANAGPVLLYLPGMHMNGGLPLAEPQYDLRVYLAAAGYRTWGLDYRTHVVPADAKPADLDELGRWNADVFTDDAAWAAAFVRGADPGPLVVAGFSYGATLAYRLAARDDQRITGLLILDGSAGGGRAPRGSGPAIDVGGTRLPYAKRQQLLDVVFADPQRPSPVPGYPTAGEALADILYTAPSFGGRGGLANTHDRVSSLRVLATLLRTYDRWWPRAALGDDPPAPPARKLPVLAFSSTRFGPAWVDSVRASAEAWGGPGAVVKPLPGYGHLDVLVAGRAARDVFAPVDAWLARAPRSSPAAD